MSRSGLSVFAAGTAGVIAGGFLVASLDLAGIGNDMQQAGEGVATVISHAPVEDLANEPAGPTETASREPREEPVDVARLEELERRMGVVTESLDGVRQDLIAQKYEAERDWDNEVQIEDATDIEMMREQEYQHWEDRILTMASESVDRHWAPQARDAFENDALDIARERGLTVVDTDCRTTQCSVTVEWPSFVEAAESFTDFLHHDYQLKCGIETLLPEPAEDQLEAPYRMTVLYDCAGYMARG